MSQKVVELEPLKFRLKGKIARLLGRESVSNAIVALSELVKNSYDADASEITVAFNNVKTENGEIHINDDGTGMSYEDFKERWMVVGTDYKEKKRITPSGRRMIGEKGIGRFAVERLARKVTIISSVKGEKSKLRVIIDWDRYETEESYFDMVENKVFLEPKEDVNHHGFELILSGLRDIWDEGALLNFKRQMSMLVPPEVLEKKDFSISVQTPEFPKLSGEIENTVFGEAFYTLTAMLESTGKVNYQMVDKKGVTTKEVAVTERTRCGPLKFTLYFYPRGFSKDERIHYKLLTLNEVRAILDNFHGIRIYRDGFRVKPYGDPKNDWLNLNMKRLYAPKYLYPDNSQVIGIVEISRDKNLGLIDTTTREGLIQNEPFKDLVDFLEKSIEFLSKRRREDRKEEQPPKTVIRTQVDRIITEIKSTNLPLPRKTRAIKELEGVEDAALGLIMVYRNLASLGITVLAVSHEITNPMGTILNYSEAILKMIKTGNYDIKQFEEAANNIRSNILRVSEFIDFVVAYNRRKRRKKLKGDLYEILNDVMKGYGAIFKKRDITVELKMDKELKEVFLYRGDFESILINFITNSLEALSFTKGKRILRVSLFSDKESVHVIFSDNGKGIPPENREIIFEPFFTTKEDGTGLGLKIVKEIVEEYGGVVKVIESELDSGASFEVNIPKSSLM